MRSIPPPPPPNCLDHSRLCSVYNFFLNRPPPPHPLHSSVWMTNLPKTFGIAVWMINLSKILGISIWMRNLSKTSPCFRHLFFWCWKFCGGICNLPYVQTVEWWKIPAYFWMNGTFSSGIESDSIGDFAICPICKQINDEKHLHISEWTDTLFFWCWKWFYGRFCNLTNTQTNQWQKIPANFWRTGIIRRQATHQVIVDLDGRIKGALGHLFHWRPNPCRLGLLVPCSQVLLSATRQGLQLFEILRIEASETYSHHCNDIYMVITGMISIWSSLEWYL